MQFTEKELCDILSSPHFQCSVVCLKYGLEDSNKKITKRNTNIYTNAQQQITSTFAVIMGLIYIFGTANTVLL